MQQWLVFAGFTFLLWGAWGVVSKLATQHINPASVLLFQAIAFLCAGFIPLLLGFRVETYPRGVLFALLAGLLLGLGDVFYFFAIEKGKVSVIFPLVALYPVVTICLAFLVLKETITLSQGIGIAFALAATYFLSV